MWFQFQQFIGISGSPFRFKQNVQDTSHLFWQLNYNKHDLLWGYLICSSYFHCDKINFIIIFPSKTDSNDSSSFKLFRCKRYPSAHIIKYFSIDERMKQKWDFDSAEANRKRPQSKPKAIQRYWKRNSLLLTRPFRRKRGLQGNILNILLFVFKFLIC